MFDKIQLPNEDLVFKDNRNIETIHVKITPRDLFIIESLLNQYSDLSVTKSSYIRSLIENDITSRIDSGFFDLNLIGGSI